MIRLSLLLLSTLSPCAARRAVLCSRMRWRQMPCASLSLTCGRGAFLPSPQLARSGSNTSYRLATGARTNTSRTLSLATRAGPSESLRREYFQIRGGWGGGWGRRQSTKHESSLTLKAQEDDDLDAEIRGGALPRTTDQTSALDIFSGPIKLQVICCFGCPQVCRVRGAAHVDQSGVSRLATLQ